MLVGVAFLPPSFPPSGTQAFYIIERKNCVYFCNRVYFSFIYLSSSVCSTSCCPSFVIILVPLVPLVIEQLHKVGKFLEKGNQMTHLTLADIRFNFWPNHLTKRILFLNVNYNCFSILASCMLKQNFFRMQQYFMQ